MPRTILLTIGGTQVYGYNGNTVFAFETGLSIDADGSPHAYHPGDTGLDSLANAKDKHGNFVGLLIKMASPSFKRVLTPPLVIMFLQHRLKILQSWKQTLRDMLILKQYLLLHCRPRYNNILNWGILGMLIIKQIKFTAILFLLTLAPATIS